MLEIAVLGLLSESPMHGYELRKRLSNLLGAFRAFSYGSLYPTLRRLAEAGWISEEESIEPIGVSASRSRRGKRVYRMTAEGKEHLAELLAGVGPDAFDDEGFGARLAFFGQTRSDIRLQILEGRRRRVEEQRDGMKSTLARTGERLDRYTRELHEHGLESVDREVRWLTELIESERSDAPSVKEQPAVLSAPAQNVNNNNARP
jgi:DNA-binding PadR family transcriptional regulator